MRYFTDAALHGSQKAVDWSGQLSLVLSGEFSKISCLSGTVDLSIKFIWSDAEEVNKMELTSPPWILRQARVIILTTHKLNLRMQILLHSLVCLPHPLLVGHPPVLAEVRALGWFWPCSHLLCRQGSCSYVHLGFVWRHRQLRVVSAVDQHPNTPSSR